MFGSRRQEEVAAEREEIDRQKKLLLKKRPSNETSRKRFSNCQNNSTVPNSSASPAAANSTVVSNNNTVMHNGIDHGIFLKPDAVLSNTLSWQEYYEADEILKVIFTPICNRVFEFLAFTSFDVVFAVKAVFVKERRRGFTNGNGEIRERT